MREVYRVNGYEFLRKSEAEIYLDRLKRDGFFSTEMEVLERCNCETQSCSNHWPGSCPRPADPHLRVKDLGAVCAYCIGEYPAEYHVPICSQCGDLAKDGPNCNGSDCHKYPFAEHGIPRCSTCNDKGLHASDCPDCGK